MARRQRIDAELHIFAEHRVNRGRAVKADQQRRRRIRDAAHRRGRKACASGRAFSGDDVDRSTQPRHRITKLSFLNGRGKGIQAHRVLREKVIRRRAAAAARHQSDPATAAAGH